MEEIRLPWRPGEHKENLLARGKGGEQVHVTTLDRMCRSCESGRERGAVVKDEPH